MWNHDDDAVAFIDEGLEAVFVDGTIEDIAVHPLACEVRRADKFDAHLKNVGERIARDGGTFRGRFFREDTMNAREGAGTFEAEDVEEEACEAACECHGNAIRNGVDKCAEEAQHAIFEIDCYF